MNQEMNRVFLRIHIEAGVHFFGQEKLGDEITWIT